MLRKHFFLTLLLALFAFTGIHPVMAAGGPNVFGVQRNAHYPYLSRDGRLLIVDTKDNIEGFQVWDAATKKPLWKSGNRSLWLSLSPDSQTIVMARSYFPIKEDYPKLQDVNLELRSARDGRFLRELQGAPLESEGEDFESLLDFDFSADGREFRLATPLALRRWNVKDGRLKSVTKWAQKNAITSLALVPEKEQALVYDGELVVVNTRTGETVRDFPDSTLFGSPDAGNFLEVSPDGFSFYELRDDSDTSRVFRFSDAKVLWSSSDWPTFSFDGKRAFVPSPVGLEIFDAHTGRKFGTIPGPKEYGFEPSPDGNWVYEARAGKIWKWRAR